MKIVKPTATSTTTEDRAPQAISATSLSPSWRKSSKLSATQSLLLTTAIPFS